MSLIQYLDDLFSRHTRALAECEEERLPPITFGFHVAVEGRYDLRIIAGWEAEQAVTQQGLARYLEGAEVVPLRLTFAETGQPDWAFKTCRVLEFQRDGCTILYLIERFTGRVDG